MKPIGKKGLRQKKAKKSAKDMYFEKFGIQEVDGTRSAWCQISGLLMYDTEAVDACHKVRASHQGGEDPTNLVIGKRLAHSWMDSAGSKSLREQILRASEVNSQVGGVIKWPPELEESLLKYMGVKTWT